MTESVRGSFCVEQASEADRRAVDVARKLWQTPQVIVGEVADAETGGAGAADTNNNS